MHANPFSDAELARRVHAVRDAMQVEQLDLLLLSSPENIFYLTGLDHWGYFAPHLLLVPISGEMVLVTRQMERVSIEHMVRNAQFVGHSDSETAADLAARHLKGFSGRAGIESWSSGLAYGFAQRLTTSVAADWCDASGLIDQLRLVKSKEEQALMRRAAVAGDAGTQAAIAAIEDGAPESEVAAECLAAMTRAGSTPPGFGPFIRPDARIAEEHTSWGDGVHQRGHRVFLEIAGCVARYNAPQGRLVHIGGISDQDAAMAEIATAAFDGILSGLQPGATAADVYQSWQNVVNEMGMPQYVRHHCGYLVGIGFPPSWTGGNRVTGLRHDSELVIETGMTFHAMSWFTETGRGDYFISNTVLLSENGADVLTQTDHGPWVR